MRILDDCILCGVCVEVCPVDAIYVEEDQVRIDNDKCIDCATCAVSCPRENISFD